MRFRAYRQLENSDCGITCIRMIARHYGKRIPLKHLRSLADISKLGISVKDIIDGFHSIRMEAAAVRISVADIYRMPCPAIIYWQQRHFVVVYEIDPKRKIFHIADPAEGKMKNGEKRRQDSVYEGRENNGIRDTCRTRGSQRRVFPARGQPARTVRVSQQKHKLQ